MENKIKQVIVYDLAQLPLNKTMEQVIDEFNEKGLITWDSSNTVNKSGPYVCTIHISE